MPRTRAPHRIPRLLLPGLALTACLLGDASAQCILANPSFEIGGSGGSVIAGWNQFGSVGRVFTATHCARAARVSGPDNGGWDVSGYWQRMDSAPGERWEATGHVRHPATRPLTGNSRALVNIEWRDAADQLIDYQSFAVADPGSPADTYLPFALLSDPAPAGTAAIHFLLGVLQGPDDPSPDAYFDQVTIFSTSPPTMDEMQWSDFPGGETLEFAGRSWRIKGPGYYGPGPNVYCDEADCVWVDGGGALHLTLAHREGIWASTEVALEEALGYGDYIVTTEGRLDLIDPQAVLGIFLWQYGPCWDESYLWWNPYNEIDIEYSRWGNPDAPIGQLVAQPYDYPGNLERFDAAFGEGEVTSHAMRWLSDRVEFRVWRGGPEDESTETMIHAWNYAGPHIPRPEQPRLHLNLWKLAGTPAADQEVVVQGFAFVPAGAAGIEEAEDRRAAAQAGRLLPVGPGLLDLGTRIRFELDRRARVDLGVFSLDGRRVRTLASGILETGIHTAEWDGRDAAGRQVGSGVYLVRLSGAGSVATGKVTLLK